MFDKELVGVLPRIRIDFDPPRVHDAQKAYMAAASARAPDGRELSAAGFAGEHAVDGSEDPASLLGEAAGVAIAKLLNESDILTELICSCGARYRLDKSGKWRCYRESGDK